MTSLLAIPFAIVLTAFVGLLLIALLAAVVLLLLLALLTLDLLLERNGVDRRAGVREGWERLRRPAPAPDSPTAPADASPAPTDGERDGSAAAEPRIPFSARRPARPASQSRATSAAQAGPEAAPAIEGSDPVAEVSAAPTPAAEAVTEVLTVPSPPARARAPRTPRAAPRRTPTAAPTPDVTPDAAPAVDDGPAPAADPAPVDRDSVMDRLFAPLLESDRTEPLPTPRAARPPRKPRDQG